MFTHCYKPSSMIKSIIVPLVKNKCGNLADKINYRPIALSSISSKVFEHVILFRLEGKIERSNLTRTNYSQMVTNDIIFK